MKSAIATNNGCRLPMDIYIGFDSAWTDNPKSPGAICAVPTLVPNLTGMRPVERTAASLISWLGGGVQPSNQGKVGMFCDASPIWRFLAALGAEENPERARIAADGLYLMEVFPALALASLDTLFYGRLKGPRYNPDRKTFRIADWRQVAEAAAREAHVLGCDEKLAEWCCTAGRIAHPRKADQDKLDSIICVLIALRWRLRPRHESLLIGDLTTGYMVLPSNVDVRNYLTVKAQKHLVAMDGEVPRK